MQIWLNIGEAFARISMGAILNSLWEGFALAVVAWLALRAVPRANASVRYALWCIALIGVLALPLIAIYASAAPVVSASADPAVAVPQRLAQVMFALWYIVATILVLRLIGSYVRLQQLKASASPLPPLYQHRVRRWLEACGGHRACRLILSDKVPMPVAIGLFDPVIVLPERLIEQLSDDEFDQIGLHELAHLQRWDDYTNVFQKLVEALLFFNPAVYMIGRQLTLEREIACDDRVIAATGKPLTYAWCLTRLVEATALTRQALPALGALSTRRQFAIRIERLLEKRRQGLSMAGRVAAAVACGAIVAALVAAARVGPLVAITQEDGYSAAAHVAVAPQAPISLPKRIAIIVTYPRHAAAPAAVTAASGPLAFVQSAIAKIGRATAVARSNAVGARNFTYAYRVTSHGPYTGGHVRVYEIEKVQVVTPAGTSRARERGTKPAAGAVDIIALSRQTHDMVGKVSQMDVYVSDAHGGISHVHVRVAPDLVKMAKTYAAEAQSYAKMSDSYAKASTGWAKASNAYAKVSQQYATDSQAWAHATSAAPAKHATMPVTPPSSNPAVPAVPPADGSWPSMDVSPAPPAPPVPVSPETPAGWAPQADVNVDASDASAAALVSELRAERSVAAQEAIIEKLQDHVEAIEARLALLDAMLHDTSYAIKLEAVQALAANADRHDVQAALLTGLRASESTRVKLAIIYSLAGRLHYTFIRDGLADVFNGSQPEAVQLAAAESLASLADDQAGQATLLQALGNTSFARVKLNIIESLTAKIQEPAVRKALQAALRSDQPIAVQLAAIQALAPAADDPDVRAALEQAGGSGCDVVRLSIRRALSQRQTQ
jgi:beta-lactamase regulating signal transducer with metallopeptidase domain